MSGDLVGLAEAAYRTDVSERDWLTGIADSALPILQRGFGLNVYTYDFSNPEDLRVCECIGTGGAPVDGPDIQRILPLVPWETMRNLYTPGPPLLLSQASSGSERRILLEAVQKLGIGDVLGIRAGDPSMRGCVLAVGVKASYRVPPLFAATLARVSAHIAAGWRLRTLVPQGDVPAAVLDVDGNVLHAETEESQAQRRALSRAAVQRNWARQELRTVDPPRAIALWRALVQGEWSLVDWTDTDGKRFLLARRNRPGTLTAEGLTDRELQVATYAALGHPLKLIAYELGLSSATVSLHLKSALRKLGLQSRTELQTLLELSSDGRKATGHKGSARPSRAES